MCTLTLDGSLLVCWGLNRAGSWHGLQVVALAVLVELVPQPAYQGAKLVEGVCRGAGDSSGGGGRVRGMPSLHQHVHSKDCWPAGMLARVTPRALSVGLLRDVR
jgi:hypothetical protein